MSHGSPRPRKRMSGRTEDMFGHDFDPLTFEQGARKSGYTRIAGLDEAGRGPLAGPVVAAAVILPEGLLIRGLTDSKLVGEADRERLFDQILAEADCHGIGIVDERTIDEVNIYERAFTDAEVQALYASYTPDLVAAYSFNEGADFVTADLSGNGHTGTLLNNTAWAADGKVGTGLHFDGVDDAVEIADTPDLRLGTHYSL